MNQLIQRLRFAHRLLILGWMCFGCTAQPTPPDEIHIVYTANLNGALTDCNCGGSVVGGMARTMTLIDSLRYAHPDLLLLDAGDALLSYPLPEANAAMLRLLSLAKYDAVNVGDHEFVESDTFVSHINLSENLRLPLVSATLQGKDSNPPFPAYQTLSLNGYPVQVIGAVAPDAFGFIDLKTFSTIPAEESLQSLKNGFGIDIGIQILLFHGTYDAALHLCETHPWIDIVILGHNQEQRAVIRNGILFLEPGFEGEYLGHLVIHWEGDKQAVENRFIPVKDNIPPQDKAMAVVRTYLDLLSN